MIFQKHKPVFQNTIKFVLGHKFIAVIIVLALIFGGYFGYKAIFAKKDTTRYVTAAVEKGTLIVSISGSGQVSASDQVDIKAKTSGDIVYLGIQNGQEVKSDTLLAQVDTTNTQRAVQDAEINLETAQVQLEELLEPPDELTLLQAENSLTKAKESKQNAEDNIVQGYEDAFNAITDVFFDLPTIITDLNTILYSYEIADSERNLPNYWNITTLENSVNDENRDELKKFIRSAEDNYKIAKTKYNKNFENYRDASRYSEHDIIEVLLEETLETSRAMAETIKSEINMLDFWVDYRSRRSLPVFSTVSQYQSDLKSYTSKTNSYLSSLLKIQKSFEDNRQAVLDAEYSIKEKELSLEDLKEGATDLEIRTKKIAVQQKEDALNTARENLASCYIRAPFDGIVAKLNVKKGDSVSSSTTVTTFITKQRIAEITLNEIDIAKVKTGQKVTITFDAIEGLSITGEVVEVGSIGAVTQGVVTYSVKIAFDTQDERVKPGMSASVAIITDVKQNVLLVPNSAVKQQGETAYVEVMAGNTQTPQPQPVEVGLSNDTVTEVTNGLKEGDTVITQTITSGTSTTQQSSNSFRMPGVTGGGGGFQIREVGR